LDLVPRGVQTGHVSASSILATAITCWVIVAGCGQAAATLPPALEDPGNGSPPVGGAGSNASPDAGSSTPTTGGAVVVLASGVATPTSIALGPSNVYWTDGAGSVWSVPRGGGSATQITSGQGNLVSLAVNAGLGSLYWVNAGDGMMGGGSVVAYDVSSATATPLVSNLVGPSGIAEDGQYVYWTDQSPTQAGVEVAQVPVGGGPDLELGTVTGELAAQGLAIDSENAYFASSQAGGGGSIATVPLAGGGFPDTLWETTAGAPTAVALGASALYWLISSPPPQGAVWGVTLPGGKPLALASGLDSPKQLAVDTSLAYWTSPASGEVLAVSLGGGTPTVMASGLSAPTAIAVDDAIYVTTSSTIVRIPK
jgi:sugar lactone lactonase YvrE